MEYNLLEAGICLNCLKKCKGGTLCEECESILHIVRAPKIEGLMQTELDYICDNIFLGSQGAAIDLQELKRNKIDRVVVAAIQCQELFKEPKYGIEYLYLPIEDNDQEDIAIYFDQVIDFIQKRRETNVLVHCRSGVSRSATLVIAYVIKVKCMSAEDAYYFVHNKRNVIMPNNGLQSQLKKYHEKLQEVTTSDREEICEFSFQGYHDAGGYIIYKGSIQYKDKKHTFNSRYSRLRQIVGQYQKLQGFPKKNVFGTKKPKFIEERQRELQVYFNSCIQDKEKIIKQLLLDSNVIL